MIAVLSFFAFTVMVAVVSWYYTRREDQTSTAGYYLAGNSLPWFVVTGSLMLTNLSTEQLVGLNGGAYLNGAIVMAWEVVAAAALILMAVYFLPRYWAGKISTIPQFLESRFDANTRRFASFIFLLSLVVNFLPFVLYSGAIALNGLFNLPDKLGLSPQTSILVMTWFIGLVGAAYAIFGGLKAVAVSDSINGVGLFAGGLLIPFLGLLALGDGNFVDGCSRLLEFQRPKLNPVGASDSPIPLGTLFTGLLLVNIFYWCTNQAIVQRVFGAKSLVEAQKGVLGAAFLKLLGPLYLVLPGIIALELLGPNLTNGDLAYPLLVQAVLPASLVGLFAAVIFGAIMSSFNSALHSSATLFGLDIYKAMLRPQATERQTVLAGKLFASGLALTAILVAPYIANAPDGLYDLMKRINAIFNIPILSIIVMAIARPQTPAWAAKTALFGGMLIYLSFAYLMGETVFGLKIHWLHFAGLNFAFLCTFMFVAGYKYPSWAQPLAVDGPGTQDSTQWHLLVPMSVAVIVLVVGLYVGMAAF
jgi:solute:Na+ symporter, SSS family